MQLSPRVILLIATVIALTTMSARLSAQQTELTLSDDGTIVTLNDSIAGDDIMVHERIIVEETDTLAPTVVTAPGYTLEGLKEFNPDPSRAVWLSALFPGLGQIYNRRFWKLPIIVAGFMGLGYGTAWNARMFSDYSLAYQDIMDDDPDTKSYMDFFPPTVSEDSLDKSWLAQTFKSRKDYYRRNRDLCIICCVGVYLLCMVDAYVDAHLTHFDISPNLSMDVAPAIISDPLDAKPKLAMHWALTF
ncbi:MAG: hypothetical protein K2H86_03780 [Muribaculaceae bacterium]|nr:hypothetical protein [Muribaculaceae bacterium]